ncbi:MAG: acyltransferase [Chitinophagaceae bacterium]|nr:acyltransferase [Chitinophagaceae bacterium]
MKPGLTNIRYLHIVRGLAALLVVFFHAKYVFWVGGKIYMDEIGLHSITDYFLFSLDMLSSCGKECVIVFFILSAFVIRHTADRYNNQWMEFYKIRIIRIYLPFLFSLIFSVAILYACVNLNPLINTNSFREYNARLFTAYNEFSWRQVLKTIIFLEKGEFSGANYAYWSLGHELIFYFLFPVYFWLTRKGLVIFSIVSTALFLITSLHLFYYQLFFVGGIFLYDYFKNYSTGPILKNKLIYAALLIGFFIAVNLSNKMISEKFSDLVTLIFSFFIFDYVLYFVKNKNKWLMKLGDISYTLYLNHLPVLLLGYCLVTLYTGKLVFYSRVPYYAGVLFALLLAVPLYYMAEKPSIAFLKKLRK